METIGTEFDYYLIENDNEHTVPALMADDDFDDVDYLYDMEEASEDTISHLTFRPPFPRKPQMVDYHFLNGGWQVFSKKIYDVLKTADIKGLQLVPAIIRSKKGEEYSDYWIANVYHEYAFLDENLSERKGSIDSHGRWGMVLRMVLNKELIIQTPLEERLIFVTRESGSYILYHKSIVDLVLSVNPIGLKFISIEKWYNGIINKPEELNGKNKGIYQLG
ncbi:imm11 family protein [Breznakiellaceae bacterium SP9]